MDNRMQELLAERDSMTEAYMQIEVRGNRAMTIHGKNQELTEPQAKAIVAFYQCITDLRDRLDAPEKATFEAVPPAARKALADMDTSKASSLFPRMAGWVRNGAPQIPQMAAQPALKVQPEHRIKSVEQKSLDQLLQADYARLKEMVRTDAFPEDASPAKIQAIKDFAKTLETLEECSLELGASNSTMLYTLRFGTTRYHARQMPDIFMQALPSVKAMYDSEAYYDFILLTKWLADDLPAEDQFIPVEDAHKSIKEGMGDLLQLLDAVPAPRSGDTMALHDTLAPGGKLHGLFTKLETACAALEDAPADVKQKSPLIPLMRMLKRCSDVSGEPHYQLATTFAHIWRDDPDFAARRESEQAVLATIRKLPLTRKYIPLADALGEYFYKVYEENQGLSAKGR